MTWNECAAITTAMVASGFDLRSRRIPNELTFGAAAIALIVALATGGLPAAGFSLSGWLLATALWLPIYALGGMGAGDVKLLAAVGAWLGASGVFHAALYAAIAGATMAIVMAVHGGVVRQTAANIQLLVTHWRVAGFTPHAQLTLATAHSPRLAYALPILTGTVIAVWLR
jgi:prepilin peptidase CpaA